jgi:hypothetical protein
VKRVGEHRDDVAGVVGFDPGYWNALGFLRFLPPLNLRVAAMRSM